MHPVIALQRQLIKRSPKNTLLYVVLIVFSISITGFFWMLILVLFKEDFMQSTVTDRLAGLNLGFLLILFSDTLFFSRILESYVFGEYKTYFLLPMSKLKTYFIHFVSIITNIRIILYACNTLTLLGILAFKYEMKFAAWVQLVGLFLIVYLFLTSLFLSIIYFKTMSDALYNINVMHVVMGLVIPVYMLILTDKSQLISEIPILHTFSKILMSIILTPGRNIMIFLVLIGVLILLNTINYLFLRKGYLLIR